MYKRLLLALFLCIFSPHALMSSLQQIDYYESLTVAKITIEVENLSLNAHFDTKPILSHLQTKEGGPFHSLTFDADLKYLSDTFERVSPQIREKDGELNIVLKVWQKPIIRKISWEGNEKLHTKRLQKELALHPGSVFDKDQFNQAFHRVKEYYVKKGYFEAELQYRIVPSLHNNEVDIFITVREGPTGRIGRVLFNGLSKKEQSAVLHMINTKKYNLFTSWLTGRGVYKEEALEQDTLIITNYLQNEGYADARVHIETQEGEDGKLIIEISAVKGEVYHFADVQIEGNTLFSTQEIDDVLTLKHGQKYSPEALLESVHAIKTLYGEKGYIDVSVIYSLVPSSNEPVYNVNFTIEEGKPYHVGLIHVRGNTHTNKKIIIRESQITPGSLFNSRKLEMAKKRLEAMGYFKSVNIYTIQSKIDAVLGDNYRDIVIEVEEMMTGNVNFFLGLSSAENIFGGLQLNENNFNIAGLSSVWRDGLSSLRGGGEFLQARASIGKKESTYSLSWLTPYFNDSLWRFGFDLSYSRSELQSDDYNIKTTNLALFGSYPLSPYWTAGWKYRIRNSIIDVSQSAGVQAQSEEKNSGWITGVGPTLLFDSTDNTFKPHSGFRSSIEGEIAGERRHASQYRTFPFAKFDYTNSYYYPVWRRGTLKTRADFHFIYPFGTGKADFLPLSERFFLGGEGSVRGYRNFRLGPKFTKTVTEDGVTTSKTTDDPTGGISSLLLSVEYLQQIVGPVDAFVFFDGGSISLKEFDIHCFQMSYGFGLRLELGNRVPFILGMGFPINPRDRNEIQRFFFSMGGQF